VARSPDYYGCVREFHEKFGIPAPERATGSIPSDLKVSRIALMSEELAELVAAMLSYTAYDPSSGETGVRRKRHVLKIGPGESFELQENSIAFVTLEPMLRVPDYIALRFDLRIKNVYRGLLLGTGPIVDPGFEGRLSLPLHNLTTNSYRFRGGEDLIWMVFTKISPNDRWEPNGTPKSGRVGSYVAPRPDRLHAGSDVETYFEEAAASGQVVSSISESLSQARSAQSWSRAISIVTAVAALALVAGVLALIINIYMFRTDAPSRSELDQTHHQVAQLKREIGRLEQKTSLTTTQQSQP
jgi:deoxycytidine triphosphate deaminase